MDLFKDIAKAAVESVGGGDMGGNDTRAIGDIPILAKLVDYFLDSTKGELRDVVQKEVSKCRDLTIQGIAMAIKDIFELTTKLLNGQLNLAGGDGQKILNIASNIIGGGNNNNSSNQITNNNNNQQQQNYNQQQNNNNNYNNNNNNYNNNNNNNYNNQQQGGYGYQGQQQGGNGYQGQQQGGYGYQGQQQGGYGYQGQQQGGNGYQGQQQGGNGYQGQQQGGNGYQGQQQGGYGYQGQQQQQGDSAYSQQQSQGSYQSGRGIDTNAEATDRGIIEDIGNFVKTEISDMANGTDTNGFNLSNLLSSGIDANNLREAATPLITDSFKGLMEKAESGITDLITDGVINGVKSYLNINTKVKDIAGSDGFDLSSITQLFGSNDNVSRDVESNDRAVGIFGVLSKKVNEGLDALRTKNRELIHNEVTKVENVIWEQLPEAVKTPLESSCRNVMSDKGTLDRGFDLSSIFSPIIAALAEPAQNALKGLYQESHRGIEDSLAKMSEDALVSRIKKYLPFLDIN